MILRRNFKKMGKFLKAKRIKADLSQIEVAKKLGYTSPQFISNFERGLCAPPIKSLRTLIDLYHLNAKATVERILSEERAYLIKGIRGK
jgi:transcriptional regulator with XRE-family HTH domain